MSPAIKNMCVWCRDHSISVAATSVALVIVGHAVL